MDKIINALIHGIGLGILISGFILLIIFASFYFNLLSWFAFLLYFLSLIIMYTSSSYYHELPNCELKRKAEFIDNINVSFSIAITYSSIMLILYSINKLHIFISIILLSSFGIILKLLFKYYILPYLINSINIIIIYLTLSELITLHEGKSFPYIFSGIILYAVAFIIQIIFEKKRCKIFYVLWHTLFLLGSVIHFFSILFFSKNLVF